MKNNVGSTRLGRKGAGENITQSQKSGKLRLKEKLQQKGRKRLSK